MSPPAILDGGAVVTMDTRRSEHSPGHVTEGERISAVAAGPVPRDLPGVRYDRPVIERGREMIVDETEVAPTAAAANHQLLNRAGVT